MHNTLLIFDKMGHPLYWITIVLLDHHRPWKPKVKIVFILLDSNSKLRSNVRSVRTYNFLKYTAKFLGVRVFSKIPREESNNCRIIMQQMLKLIQEVRFSEVVQNISYQRHFLGLQLAIWIYNKWQLTLYNNSIFYILRKMWLVEFLITWF